MRLFVNIVGSINPVQTVNFQVEPTFCRTMKFYGGKEAGCSSSFSNGELQTDNFVWGEFS
jgi:hypothetical protein